jgi:cytochrome P450
MNMRAAVPAHVPSDRIFDFDLYRVAPGRKDLMDSVAALRTKAPGIFFTPLNGGHWVIVGYKLLTEAAKATGIFSSSPYTIPDYPDEPPLAPLLLDPPVHTVYRNVLQRVFTPSAALALRENIRSNAISLIDAVAGNGRCDFVASIAEQLPVSVFLGLLGLPITRLHEYRAAVKAFLGSADIESKRRAAAWIEDELSSAIRERQRSARSDLISELLGADLGGRAPIFEEMVNFCMMLFAAGLDTVTVSMSYGMRHLAEDQELQSWARANPHKITELTEELLRRYSAAQPGRTVTRDVEIDQVLLKKGDRVLLLCAGADLDPQVFEAPERVDPERPKKPHLAFNVGPHRCVGMHLARVELQMVYSEWISRIPPFRIDSSVTQAFTGGHVLSMNNLGLRWDQSVR